MLQTVTVLRQTFIGLFGPPGGGKSTLAKRLSEITAARHFDIDDIRKMIFGQPVPNDGTDPAIKAQDDREMAGTYKAMFGIVEAFLRAEHPLILTCTLSNKVHGQDVLKSIYTRYDYAEVRIILCWPEITLEEMRERFKERASSGYLGATTDPDRAWELRGKYHPMELPHLKLDTGPRRTVEECVHEALVYIMFGCINKSGRAYNPTLVDRHMTP